ncbi:hypothetical protein B296_00031481 [Ensete ventricosum]|uniref:Uncharacterized protein n=1 Tax=Ensete ventricosum TaxID=4639 RepID=A0A426ZM45_ENSVE|nr:hypothetical protein B296_00031481 [Ensete ventricosum]
MRKSRRQRRGLVASDKEEATSYLPRPVSGNGSRLSKESDTESPSSPFSSPSADTTRKLPQSTVPPDSEQSTYRSTGGPVRTARY